MKMTWWLGVAVVLVSLLATSACASVARQEVVKAQKVQIEQGSSEGTGEEKSVTEVPFDLGLFQQLSDQWRKIEKKEQKREGKRIVAD